MRCGRFWRNRCFDEFGDQMAALGVNPNSAWAICSSGSRAMTADHGRHRGRMAAFAPPRFTMVNSDKGITNLHVPSDVIIDASMPALIRAGGKMWNALMARNKDTVSRSSPTNPMPACTQTVIEFCKVNGAFDPRTMGSGAQRRPDGTGRRGIRLP
jgi:isocitrate dehydrogenase